jgi:dCMP deaminase
MSGVERKAQISFIEMFFLYARIAAARSKDPHTQCGACIVKDQHIVGIGYNGFTKGMPDYESLWSNETKYLLVEHAERNAIHNSDRGKLAGSSLYIWSNQNYPPCADCAKAIVQNGIMEVWFSFAEEEMSPKKNELQWDVVSVMLRKGGVSILYFPLDVTRTMGNIISGGFPVNQE